MPVVRHAPGVALAGRLQFRLVEQALGRDDHTLRLKVPPQQPDALAWLHENGTVTTERSDPETGLIYVVARLNEADAGRFRTRFPGMEMGAERAVAE